VDDGDDSLDQDFPFSLQIDTDNNIHHMAQEQYSPHYAAIE